ncbi:MAG: phosphoribosyltransferase family protein [Nanoarchaeota archaeon]
MENKEKGDKLYISADSLLKDSFLLGKKILDSGFKPSFLVGIWRGGSPVGIAVQEFLEYHGVKTDHIAIRTSAYSGIDEMKRTIAVHNLSYITEKVSSNDRVLLIDDVYETGLSLKAVMDALKKGLQNHMPQEIRIATVYFKPHRNQTDQKPDFFIHTTDQWIVFPHELCGLSLEEIEKGKGLEIQKLLKG